MQDSEKAELIKTLKNIMKDRTNIKASEDLKNHLLPIDNLPYVLDTLRENFSPEEDMAPEDIKHPWEAVGICYLLILRRLQHALTIFEAQYDAMLQLQEKRQKRIHKGMALVWISECYVEMGCPVHAKRYLMLALCEDAISTQMFESFNIAGSYWRLVHRHGISKEDFRKYLTLIIDIWKDNKDSKDTWYPEWMLEKIDQDWMCELPSPAESWLYRVNGQYVEHLLKKLDARKNENFQILAAYILSCIPGCRIILRKRVPSEEYDMLCSLTGFDVDFRAELGRYFAGEFKNWNKYIDFSAFAGFYRVLDSIKATFGIYFSKNGLYIDGTSKYVIHEQIKAFQERGIIIVVITLRDLMYIIKGGNFIALLQKKYEEVRLGLLDSE